MWPSDDVVSMEAANEHREIGTTTTATPTMVTKETELSVMMMASSTPSRDLTYIVSLLFALLLSI